MQTLSRSFKLDKNVANFICHYLRITIFIEMITFFSKNYVNKGVRCQICVTSLLQQRKTIFLYNFRYLTIGQDSTCRQN